MHGRIPYTFLLVFLLFSVVCVRGHEVVSLTTQENNGVLRVDIGTKNPLHHFTVTHVHACSSVDLEMQTYDPENPTVTGCNTPGFIARKIYGPGKTLDPAFHAHIKSRSVILNENVVDPRTPVVYIQVEMRVTDEDGLLLSPSVKSSPGDPFTLVTRYTQPEKKAADQPVVMNDPAPSGNRSNELPWYFFTMGGIGLAAACVIMGLMIVNWKTRHTKRRSYGIVVDYDMETGRSTGPWVNFIRERRAGYVEWAILQGWWKSE